MGRSDDGMVAAGRQSITLKQSAQDFRLQITVRTPPLYQETAAVSDLGKR